MTLLELIEAARSRLDDYGGSRAAALWQTDDSGCLWGNAVLLAHAAESVREFYRRTRMQFDCGPIGDMPVVAGTQSVDLHPSVLSVTRIEWLADGSGRGVVLDKTHRLEADRLCLWDRALPAYWLNDLAPGRIWLLGAPDVDGRLLLYGVRLPDEPPTDWHAGIAAAWIVPVPHERAPSLLHWIEHRALLKRDSDTVNARGSELAAARFAAEVGPPVDAITEAIQLKAAGRRWRSRGQYC